MTTLDQSFCSARELRTHVIVLRAQEPAGDFRAANVLKQVWSGHVRWRALRGDRAASLQQTYGRVSTQITARQQADIRPGDVIVRDTGERLKVSAAVRVGGGHVWWEILGYEVTA